MAGPLRFGGEADVNPKELDGIFPAGELCLVEIAGEPGIEVQREALTFTDAGVVVSGAWQVQEIHADTNTVDPFPMVGVRFIPWRRVDGIAVQTPPGGYGAREDLEDDMERYGVAEIERGELLARYDLDTGAAKRKCEQGQTAGGKLPAPPGPVAWPTSPRAASDT
jgi:hypothetical protein